MAKISEALTTTLDPLRQGLGENVQALPRLEFDYLPVFDAWERAAASAESSWLPFKETHLPPEIPEEEEEKQAEQQPSVEGADPASGDGTKEAELDGKNPESADET